MVYRKLKKEEVHMTISPRTLRKFKKYCMRHEYTVSGRIQQLMIWDMNNNFICDDFNGGKHGG